MIAIRQFFAPPVLADETSTRRAWLLSFLLNLHLVVAALVFLLLAVTNQEINAQSLAALLSWLPTLGMRAALRAHRLSLAAVLFIGMLALLMPLVALISQSSVLSVAVTAFQLLTLVMAGLLLGARGAASFWAFTVALNLGFVYAEAHHWYRVNLARNINTGLVSQIVAYTAVAALLWLANRLINEAFTRLQNENAERRRAEEALRQLNVELEGRVAARTADLLQAKESAEIANKAKSDFLSSMSHELRTPLNGILGYTQILQRRAEMGEEAQRGLRIIHDAGAHLLSLITDLLDFSKIEAQRLELLPEAVQLPALLDHVASLVRLRAEEKHLTFVFEPAPDLPLTVQADEKRLRQVLLNLLSNAIKFTDRGYVAFRIQALPAARPETITLRFEVEDSGPGLPADKLGQLFQPFEQVGDAQQRAQGTGLGLAISQRLVQAMGGQITVAGGVGEGATFAFDVTLPLSTAPAPAKVGDTQRPKIKGYRGPRRKILIADDKPYNRLVLSNLLQPVGFELLEAEDGAQAIARAPRQTRCHHHGFGHADPHRRGSCADPAARPRDSPDPHRWRFGVSRG
jgi:signal transduction histidine kinase